MNQTVIGTGINQAFYHWAFINCDQCSIGGGRHILGNGINTPDTTHDIELVAVDIATQVAANGYPALTTVIGTEQSFGTVVQPAVIVRGNDQRRTPVPVVILLICTRHGCDLQNFTCNTVKPSECPVLRLGINHIGIGRVDLCLEAVAGLGNKLVGVGDTVGLGISAGAA